MNFKTKSTVLAILGVLFIGVGLIMTFVFKQENFSMLYSMGLVLLIMSVVWKLRLKNPTTEKKINISSKDERLHLIRLRASYYTFVVMAVLGSITIIALELLSAPTTIILIINLILCGMLLIYVFFYYMIARKM